MKAASHENDFGSWSGEDDSTHLNSTTLKLCCRLLVPVLRDYDNENKTERRYAESSCWKAFQETDKDINKQTARHRHRHTRDNMM